MATLRNGGCRLAAALLLTRMPLALDAVLQVPALPIGPLAPDLNLFRERRARSLSEEPAVQHPARPAHLAITISGLASVSARTYRSRVAVQNAAG